MRTLPLIGFLTFVSSSSLALAQQAPAVPVPANPPQVAPPPAPIPQQPPPVQYAQPAPGQYAQPLAPPPPGYAYPAPQDPAQRAAVLAELSQVDGRLYALQLERSSHRIVGPIITMGGGFGAAVLFGMVGLIKWGVAEDIKRGDYPTLYDSSTEFDSTYDLNGDGVVDGEDEGRARRTARVTGTLSIIGVGVGIVGSVWLAKQLAKRRQLTPELQNLRGRKQELLRNLQYGGGYSQNGLQLTLGGTF